MVLVSAAWVIHDQLYEQAQTRALGMCCTGRMWPIFHKLGVIQETAGAIRTKKPRENEESDHVRWTYTQTAMLSQSQIGAKDNYKYGPNILFYLGLFGFDQFLIEINSLFD